MGTWNVSKMWLTALLLVGFLAGCGQERGMLPPTLTSISPNVGEQRQTLGVTLTGTNFATGATVNVGGALITVSNTTVVSSTQMTATFAIAANATLGAVNISVTTSGLTTNAVTFTITPGLAVTSTIPANGATGVLPTQTISATFNNVMDATTINSPATTFTLRGPGATPVVGVVNSVGTTATFAPGALLLPNTLYTATITTGAKDTGGVALASNYVWSFRTAPNPTVPPTVIATNPASNASGVPINQKITAAFSEAMNLATINSTTFTLAGPGATVVPGTVTYALNGSTATFAPSTSLTANTVYTATVTTGAQNLAGTGLASNYVWSFTTAVLADITKPTIVSTIAANGAVGVPTNQAVSAAFSKPMDPTTINSTTFTLAGPSGIVVPGSVNYAAVGNTATFTPTANLLPSTLYTATVTTGAKDLAGNPLGPGPVPNPWTFTTGPGPNAVNPTIVSTNPANAAVNIPVNATVNATFSKAMDPLTITTATFQLAGPGGAGVTGTVAYDPINFIATFKPSTNLALTTVYTATISTGATDLSGNPLGPGLAPNPWFFTTAPVAGPPAVNLRTASTFGSFGGSAGVTNAGILTVINGDIGTTAVSTLVTGFHDAGPGCIYTETPLNVGTVNGKIYTAPPPPTVACPTEGTAATMAIATQALADANTAYTATAPALMPCTSFCAQGGELGNRVLLPGIYESAPGTFSITAGDLTLDAGGNPNASWVFQMGSSLTVGIAGPAGFRNVILINGALAKNVFWHVGSAATINGTGGGTMVGTIIAPAGVTFSTSGSIRTTTLNGRALGLTASVTMWNTVINVPAP